LGIDVAHAVVRRRLIPGIAVVLGADVVGIDVVGIDVVLRLVPTSPTKGGVEGGVSELSA
jgi:hypothetical protein